MNQLSNRSNYELSEQQQQKIKEGQQVLSAPIASDETIIWHGKRSWIPSLFGIVFSAAFAALWLWLKGRLGQADFYPEATGRILELANESGIPSAKALEWAGYILYGFVALCVLGIVKKFLRQVNTTYTITSQRIIVKEGSLSVAGAQMELYRLKDITYARSLIGGIFGYATITLISTGRVMPILSMTNVREAPQKLDAIRRASQLARAETGRVSISE